MTDTNTEFRGIVSITINGNDQELALESLGLTMDSTEQEILNAVQGVIRENLSDDEGDSTYTVRKSLNTGIIHVYPKPVAG